MKDIYIVDLLRTPFGSFGGALSDVESPQLGGTVIKTLMEKTDLEPAAINEVIIGQVLSGELARLRHGRPCVMPAFRIASTP